MGGVHGQTNVGHWIRDAKAATNYKKYWEVISKDPGGLKGDSRSEVLKKNAAYKKDVEKIQSDIAYNGKKITDIPNGVTTIFSPRTALAALDSYVYMLDNATDHACITLAFGINKKFKDELLNNTDKNQLIFMLLEKKDGPNNKSKTPYVYIGAANNVYKAWGAYLKDPIYQFVNETNTAKLQLNSHVAYIHSKFLLMDPLGSQPVVVSGSANFSEASTTGNDENMVIINNDQRAADIYFTEFNRLFNHYYFRAVYENLSKKLTTAQKKANDAKSIFLKTPQEWIDGYKPGGFKRKRINMYKNMKGAKKG